MTVYHPRAWLRSWPKHARFYVSKSDLRIEHPNIDERNIVATAYSGPTTADHVVHVPVAPYSDKTALVVLPVAKDIAEVGTVLDANPVPTEDRRMMTPEGEIVPQGAPFDEALPPTAPAPTPKSVATKTAKKSAKR